MFMEEFEQLAINTTDHRPNVWIRYVDDTFVIWQHGQDNLRLFLKHLNGLHSSIQFTTEQERNGNISFFDVEVTRKEDGHTTSATKNSSAKNTTALQRNGYKPSQDPRSQIQPRPKGLLYPKPTSLSAPSSITLPYLDSTSHYIQRILHKYGIRVFHTAPLQLHNLLTSHKDRQDPQRRPGVYRIPCQCGKVYIGETGKDLPTRINKHKARGRKGELDESSIIKHSHTEDHHINWNQAELITSIERWWPFHQ
ncbi:uncharacterized protein LOC110989744 [Acanthaster planci]|uniref:Uncharacterized protein LOC110989744 n=1 Tax=Acanthaster planci TaxID=133434 RepID=A0A8B7ZZ65_ACAPL|nr:uncharacterized protein LOC110989744 [Acanthaster planci]